MRPIDLWYDPNTNSLNTDDGVDLYEVIVKLMDKDILANAKVIGGIEFVEDRKGDVRYEINFPFPPVDTLFYTFHYDVNDNTFVDYEGYPMFNLFEFLTPNQIALFKHTKKDTVFDGLFGRRVELVYGIPEYWKKSLGY